MPERYWASTRTELTAAVGGLFEREPPGAAAAER